MSRDLPPISHDPDPVRQRQRRAAVVRAMTEQGLRAVCASCGATATTCQCATDTERPERLAGRCRALAARARTTPHRQESYS